MQRFALVLVGLGLLLTLSAGSALAVSKSSTATLQADCSVCVVGQPITFTGSGYNHQGAPVMIVVTLPLGSWTDYSTVPDGNGNISWVFTPDGTGSWTFTAQERQGGGKWFVRATASVTLVAATP